LAQSAKTAGKEKPDSSINTETSRYLREFKLKRPFCHHTQSICRVNAIRGLLKGIGIGFAVKGGFALLGGLLFRKMYRRPLKLLKLAFGYDTARFALFLGAFNGGF
jgi:hypothetical protein